MTNEIFLLAFHEIPIMWPIACILEYFASGKAVPEAGIPHGIPGG